MINKLLYICCLMNLMFNSCKATPNTVSNKNELKPNIVYILADDLGIGDISCYGQKQFNTPNIDALAERGILFTQHYAGSTVCAPSRSVLMTGQHTGHTPIRGNKSAKGGEGQIPMNGDAITVAEMLTDCGYTSGAFGKWGLGYPGSEGDPLNQGFDTFFGYNCQVYAHRYYPTYLRSNKDKYPLEGNDWTQIETYAPEVIHEKALEFINDNKEEPFFLYLPYTLPHAELLVPNDTIYKYYENKYNEVPFVSKPDGDYGKDLRIGGYCSQEKPRATFATMVSILDLYVGDVVSELKKLGLYDNTIIMFSSDNGPHAAGGADPQFFNSNAQFRGIKRDLYEGGIRSPFIVSWPNHIKEGVQTDHLSSFWDVMPTLANIAGCPVPSQADGISFLPTLLGKKQKNKHAHLYWEFHEQGGKQAVRQGDWKLVVLKVNSKLKTKYELYNLQNDLEEKNNVASEFPKKVEELKVIIKQEHKESDVFKFNYEK